MIFSGRVLGPSYEGLVPAIAFSIIDRDSEFDRILVKRKDPLPSLSPFILYSIEAIRDHIGPLWRISRIISMKPLPVYRRDLMETLRLRFPYDAPTVIEDLEHDLGDKKDPLKLEDIPVRHSIARSMVIDACQPLIFYDLLPHFPGEILHQFTIHDLEYIQKILERHPFLLALQIPAIRMLSSGINKMRSTMNESVEIDEDTPNPLELLCSKLIFSSLYSRYIHTHLSAEASEIATWSSIFTERFHKTGDTVMEIPARFVNRIKPHFLTLSGFSYEGEEDKEEAEDLVSRKTMIPRDQRPIGDETVFVIDSSMAFIQASLALEIKNLMSLRPAPALEMVVCRIYDDARVIMKLEELKRQGWTLCASRPSLEALFGPFHFASKMVVLHAHKLGPSLMLDLFKHVRPGMIESIILVGDPDEMPGHYLSGGGGDLFSDLWNSDLMKDHHREEWAWPSNMVRHESLRKRDTNHLETIVLSTDDSLRRGLIEWVSMRKSATKTIMKDGIKSIKKIRSEQTWVILCSDEARRKQVCRWLDLDEIRPGQRLHILDTDEVGTIVHAHSVTTKKAVTKKGRLYDELDYEIHLDTGGGGGGESDHPIIRFQKSKVNMRMCDVALTTSWIGPVVDAVLFVCSDTFSSMEEIGGSMKYAKKEFRLVLTSRDQLVEIPWPRPHRTSAIPMFLRGRK